MKMTNAWNRVIYRLWAPIYDGTVGRIFMPGRRRAMQLLNLKPGERVLLPGVGTGEDIPFIPAGAWAFGLDLSPDMLLKARRKLDPSKTTVFLAQGDAQLLPVRSNGFDAVVLNLILSVVPDGRICLQAAQTALKPGGRVVVFDKFLPSGRLSLI